MRNLKKYSNHSGYSADERALGYNVSICKSENHTHYDKKFPYDSKVVYIEFPVGAYIDSGIVFTNTTGFKYHFQRTSTRQTWIIGWRRTTNPGCYVAVWTQNDKHYINWNNSTYQAICGSGDDIISEAYINYYNSRKAVFDNIEAATTLADLIYIPSVSMYIGAVRQIEQGTLYNNSQPHRCFGCVITEGNQVVRDYVPVRIGTTGYLYDRVSGQLFGNVGSGTITVGNDAI